MQKVFAKITFVVILKLVSVNVNSFVDLICTESLTGKMSLGKASKHDTVNLQGFFTRFATRALSFTKWSSAKFFLLFL